MPSPTPLHGQPCPDAEDINASIRQLMDQPATARRAEEYRRLLELWTVVTREDVASAA